MRHATAGGFDQPSGRAVSILSTRQQLIGLEAAWLDLETQSPAPTFFQSFAWTRFVMAVLEAQHLNGSGTATNRWQPRILVISDHRRPALIWPLALVRGAGMTVVQDLTEPFGQYSDALLSPDADRDAVLSVALDEIKTWDADALMLSRVRADAQLTPWLRQTARRIGTTRQAPFVSFSEFGSFAEYRRSIKPKTRKNLRNYRNRLARDGALNHRLVTDQDEISHLTRTCMTWRTEWLAATGLSSLAFRHPAFLRLIIDLAAGHHGAPPMQLMLLERDIASSNDRERIIAIQWGFRHGERYCAFMSAKNPQFDAFSPGRLHLEDVIEICAAQGIATVDLLPPDMPYKATWATGRTDVDGYGLAMTLKGRVLIDVWHDTLRPRFRNAMLNMPIPVRRLALGKTG